MSGSPKRLVRPATTFLVPLVGITLLDWQLRSVLLFYWFEIGVTIARQTVEATFAARPNSEEGRMFMPMFRRLRTKRGAISIPGPFPPVYPRTAPSVVVGGTLSLAIWVIAGTQIVALGGRVDLSAPPLEILLGSSADSPARLAGHLFGVFGIVVGQLSTFVSNVQHRSYEKLSARAIVGPLQILGPTVFLLVFIAGLFLSGGKLPAVRVPVFVGIVVVRACVDALDELGVTERYTPDRLNPDTQIGDRDPVASGEGEPRTVWQADRGSLAFARALTSPGRVFPTRGGIFVGLVAVFLWAALDGTTGVVAAAGLLVTVAVIGAVPLVIERDLLHGHLEYRLYDDCLVAYDRLLETPQWRVGLDAVRETESSVALLDRLPGVTLERLFVRTDDESRRLVGLADAEGVHERIDEARFE
jgi:hypothetical protein